VCLMRLSTADLSCFPEQFMERRHTFTTELVEGLGLNNHRFNIENNVLQSESETAMTFVSTESLVVGSG
jgi:hypothetical protein